MKRRDFLAGSALAAGSMLIGGRPRAEGRRPNVLLVIVDQWRQRCWFPDSARLPASERLAREGMSFTNFFTSAVPCSPSRATLLTGLHITQHGIESNVNGDLSPSLDPSLPTLGHLFRDAGYSAPYFGKWHLTDKKITRRDGLEAYGFTDWVPPDYQGAPYEGLIHDAGFADQTIDWLRQNHGQDRPWFLTLSLVNPHDVAYYSRFDIPPALAPDTGCELPPNFNDDLGSKPRIQAIYQKLYGKIMGSRLDRPDQYWRQYLDFYYYLTRKADQQVGRVLDELDRLGLASDTLVVFTSDHGEMAGSHHLQAKGPFVYQENTNIPLIVRWPGRVPAGATSEALGHNPDVFPTLVDVAGLEVSTDHLPGRSLLPVLLDPQTPSPHECILMTMGEFLRDPSKMNWYVRAAIHSTGVSARRVAGQLRGLYDGRYKFARYFGQGAPDEFELYDRQEDPYELINLASDPARAGLRRELEDRLQQAVERDMDPERAVRRKDS